MVVNSCDVKAAVCDQFFFMDFIFCGSRRNKLPIPQFMANMMAQISSLCINPFVSYIYFS